MISQELTDAKMRAYRRELNLIELEEMRQQLTEVYKHLHAKIVDFEQENEQEIKAPEFRKKFMELCVDLGIDPMNDRGMIKIKRYYHRLAVRLLGSFTEFESLDHAAKRLKCEKEDIKSALGTIKDISDIHIKKLEDGTEVLCRKGSDGVSVLARIIRGQEDWNRAYKEEELAKYGLGEEQISALLSVGNLAIDSQGPGGWFEPDYWIVM